MPTATDYFCGMGGSSSGPTEAGFAVQVAEQQMQAGNAAAVNVAHWLGRQVAEVLS